VNTLSQTDCSSIDSYTLFTDVSLDTGHKCGIGAYLFIPVSFFREKNHSISKEDIAVRLKIRRFENTSSTRLEVQTVLWALDEIEKTVPKHSLMTLQVYTDSQCVAGLQGRRSRLSSCNFLSKKTGQPLKNADLYRTFYELNDKMGFSVTKVSGHTPASSRDTIHHIFACVDQEARKALKSWDRKQKQ
jgi:ribonuclease HI